MEMHSVFIMGQVYDRKKSSSATHFKFKVHMDDKELYQERILALRDAPPLSSRTLFNTKGVTSLPTTLFSLEKNKAHI